MLGKRKPRGTLKRSAKQQAILAAMARTAELESERLQRRLSYLHLIATIAPLLGLLGTVWGLLETFNSLACSDCQGHHHLTEGMRQAFVSTWMGLAVAMPANLLFLVLKNRATLITLEVNAMAKRLLAPLPLRPWKTRTRNMP